VLLTLSLKLAEQTPLSRAPAGSRIWALLGNVVLALVGAGAPLVTVGIGGGVLAAVLGHYFGRDLRVGLTREV